jgi:hypothetical protein
MKMIEDLKKYTSLSDLRNRNIQIYFLLANNLHLIDKDDTPAMYNMLVSCRFELNSLKERADALYKSKEIDHATYKKIQQLSLKKEPTTTTTTTELTLPDELTN